MITLCMDTAHRYLVLAILKDDKIIASYSEYAWKKQSEIVFVELNKLMQEAGVKPDDIAQMVITKGPGSYTGIRIAMTIAKVFCTTKPVKLYTLGTLQLYAGMADNAEVILDARSNRVYYGHYLKGVKQSEGIKTLDELVKDNPYIGDVELLDKTGSTPDFVANFLALKPLWEPVNNVHTLIPEYFKEESEYLK